MYNCGLTVSGHVEACAASRGGLARSLLEYYNIRTGPEGVVLFFLVFAASELAYFLLQRIQSPSPSTTLCLLTHHPTESFTLSTTLLAPRQLAQGVAVTEDLL